MVAITTNSIPYIINHVIVFIRVNISAHVFYIAFDQATTPDVIFVVKNFPIG